MPQPLLVPGWLVFHFLLGLLGTWLAMRYALGRQLIDQPDARRSHVVPTPRGGGIAIVLAVLLAMAAVGYRLEGQREAMWLLGAGLVLVAGVGWIDDHRSLSPWPRLAVQSVSAGLLAAVLLQAGAAPLLAFAGFIVAMGLMNIWNFMDGIDGIAASQAALVGAGYAMFVGGGPGFWIGLALAAAACGFLPFNLPRARIFLGDVGSGAIGYVVACLLAFVWLQSDAGGRLLALSPLLPFGIDASMTLAVRVLNGERWWTPHVQHLYQRWARRLGTHGPVTAGYAVIATGMLAFMFGARFASLPFIIVAVSVCCLAGMAAWWWLRPLGLPNSDHIEGPRT